MLAIRAMHLRADVQILQILPAPHFIGMAPFRVIAARPTMVKAPGGCRRRYRCGCSPRPLRV
jgi:hypothetical protein